MIRNDEADQSGAGRLGSAGGSLAEWRGVDNFFSHTGFLASGFPSITPGNRPPAGRRQIFLSHWFLSQRGISGVPCPVAEPKGLGKGGVDDRVALRFSSFLLSLFFLRINRSEDDRKSHRVLTGLDSKGWGEVGLHVSCEVGLHVLRSSTSRLILKKV